MTIINATPDRTIQIGYEGEDNVTKIIFRYDSEWLENGEGIFNIRVRRHGEHTAYNAQLVTDDAENNCLLMTVTNTELSVKGSGEMQVVYSGADFVKKSPIYSYNVSRAVDEAIDPPAQDVYTQIIESLSDLQTDVQGKADIQTVSALADAVQGLDGDVQGLQTIVQGKADIQTVSALSDAVQGLDGDVQGLQTAVQAKADTATVTALSGTVSSLQTAVQSKADTSTVTALSGTVSSLQTAVQGKADAQTVTALSGTVTGLQANKADKTYVDTELAGKASIAVATTSSDGLMSAQDKSRLDAVSLLKEQIYNSYPNVEAETASVVSITDGADGIPVKSLVVSIDPVQAGSGDPSPDNVRPISGWTGCEIQRAGKNLLDIDRYGVSLPRTANGITWSKVRDGIYHVQGTATGSSFLNVSFPSDSPIDAMPCISFRGHRLFLSTTNPNVIVASGYFREDGSYTQLPNGSVISDEAVALRAYLKINPNNTIDADFSVQLELGSTATAYEPYHAESYGIAFPSEAGTVYGGSLDVTNGVLTVDKAIVDLGTLSWASWLASGTYIFNAVVDGKKQKRASTLICSQYKTNYSISILDNLVDYEITGSNDNSRVYIRDQRFTDNATFTTAMSGVQLVYELAEPITYQLIPTEVKTLLGANNVWTDTGDVQEMVYRADTKLYVDGVRADHSSMIAPVEKAYTATRNYTTGQLLIVDNTLYKVTANIANGGTITVGTNVVATTLSEVILALA